MRAHTAARGPSSEVPAWLWLWLAPLMVLVQIAILAWDRDLYDKYIDSETGLVENGTAAILLAVILGGVLALRHRRALASRMLTLWLAAVTLGCFYFAGEEVSRGPALARLGRGFGRATCACRPPCWRWWFGCRSTRGFGSTRRFRPGSPTVRASPRSMVSRFSC